MEKGDWIKIRGELCRVMHVKGSVVYACPDEEYQLALQRERSPVLKPFDFRGIEGELKEWESDALVCRDPVYAPGIDTVAYGLRFGREGLETPTADQLENRPILDVMLESGLERIVGDNLVFLSLSPEAIRNQYYQRWPRNRIIVELRSGPEPVQDRVRLLRELRKQGWGTAVTESSANELEDSLAALADVIRVDVGNYESNGALGNRVAELRRHKARLLAHNLRSYAQFEDSRELGFDYFQGPFYLQLRPSVEKLPVNEIAAVRLLTDLQDSDITIEAVEQSISQDLTLSYKLLRYVNSASVSLPRAVESIGHAAKMIGVNRIRTWASILMFAKISNKPRELMMTAIRRGKMCEQLADATQDERAIYFTAGLLSVLDALLNCSLEDAIASLPLSEELCQALLTHAGPVGAALACTIAYERGDWKRARLDGVHPARIRSCYLDSVTWSLRLVRELNV